MQKVEERTGKANGEGNYLNENTTKKMSVAGRGYQSGSMCPPDE